MGPGDSSRSHKADEYILVSEIHDAIEKYIEKYNHDNVFLENGVKLHLTRTYYKNFKKAYFEYFNIYGTNRS